MGNVNKTAHDVAGQEAHRMVRSIGEDILAQIASGDLEDDDAIREYLESRCDDSCIYTADQWVLAFGLPDGDSFDDVGFSTQGNVEETFNNALTAKAYWNLFDQVMSVFGTQFEGALAVKADEREEAAS